MSECGLRFCRVDGVRGWGRDRGWRIHPNVLMARHRLNVVARDIPI